MRREILQEVDQFIGKKHRVPDRTAAFEGIHLIIKEKHAGYFDNIEVY